ncbi:hypothetical protein PSA7680_00153 [Pseudoruegeria aquimaris]|uniref:5-aminolevulic acid synthase n=1 Tax=Pseudoruegeria aquimaris TaxID=393663 RepID=A0A1Y5R8I3_9RHOB|nr:hypothetical protein [Pseudoruegeria aquimaris]SLN11656.1 hypothetical protein PSA7680_00153 [Pseudoruegeria aquimaris]
MRKILTLVLGVAGLAAAGAASAQVFSEKEARAMLFPEKGIGIAISKAGFLSDQDRKLLEEVAKTQNYYAAVAVPPDEGMFSNAAASAANFHRMEDAEVAALATCNDRRNGGAPCEVVLRVYPKGWKPQPLQLSRDATEGFRKEYRRARAPKAMAISPKTGEWSVFRGDGAQNFAVSNCNGKSTRKGAADCLIVIKDD